MTTRLNNAARTILRSRVRRHPEIARHFTGDVASLPNADLIQIGMLLGLDVPTDAELKALDQIKAAGRKGKRALRDLDVHAVNILNVGGSGLAAICAHEGLSLSGNPVLPDDDEDEIGADEPDTDEPATDAPAPAPADTDADTDAKVEAELKDLQGQFAACMAVGDMKPYQAAVRAIIERANKPAPKPIIQRAAHIDPSKIKGHVPTAQGEKTRQQAGIKCPSMAREDATALTVYDAPDAPTVNPDYVWPDLSDTAFAAMRCERNVFLWGPAGTGKTEFARQVAARWGRPFVRISCDDQTDGPTLVGMTGMDGKGGMEWRDGQLAAAIRKPGTVILVDEPSVARPGAVMALQAVLDDDRTLHVAETGEAIPVAPGVIFILADNTNGTGDETGQYEATRRLNRATLDRMAVTLRVDYLPADVEARTIATRTGLDQKRAMVLAKFAALTRRGADGGQVSHGLGLRRMLAMGDLLAAGVNPTAAFQVAVLESVPYDDREPLRQMWSADVPRGAL